MKKTLSMLLVLALVVALFAACGSTAAPASDAGSAAGSAAASAEAPADEGGEAAAPAAEPAAEAGSAVEDSAVEEAPEEEQLAGDPMEAMKEEFISYPLEEGGTISMWYYTPPYVQFVDSNANFNALKAAEEATGVKLDFIEVGSASASEQFNLMVAGGDMTDLIPVIEYYSSGVTKAYEEDVIMDIEPYVEEYMPNFAAVRECLSEKTQKQLMTDGALLAFYQVNDGSFAANGQVTRGDWLDELGISFDSTLISLDQFDDMLHQMHDKYNVAHTIYFTDGTLPLNAVFDTSIPTLVGDGFMTSVSSAIFRRGDECVSGWNQDGYRDYLEYVLQLMDDGLIDKDFMGLDGDQGVRNTAYANGDVAIWQMGADTLEETCKRHRGDDRYDLDAGRLPRLHVLARIARACHDDRDLLLGHNLGNLVGEGALQHDVDAEGLCRAGAAVADLVPEPVGIGIHRGDDAEASGIRYGSGEACISNPCHAALEDRLLDACQVAERSLDHTRFILSCWVLFRAEPRRGRRTPGSSGGWPQGRSQCRTRPRMP